MALIINEDCTACDACVEPCPNTAITAGSPIYLIDPAKCTECVGAHDEPQCVTVCPADCIVPDPNHAETREELEARVGQLGAGVLGAERGRQHAVVDGQHRLDEPGGAGGRHGVADHRLHRAEDRPLGRLLVLAEHAAQGVELGAVAGDGGRAVALDEADERGVEPGRLVGALEGQDLLWQGYTGGRPGSAGISAFPSMHVATATLFALAARRLHPRLFPLGLAYWAVIMLGSVLLAWHYAVDGYVGILLGWGAVVVSDGLEPVEMPEAVAPDDGPPASREAAAEPINSDG